jgi:O-antigen/teichoic acid export membrane protein
VKPTPLQRRLLNVALRGVTLIAKFLLLFALARVLDPSEVGLFGLVFATVTYVLYAIGLDFYAYANRELAGAEPPARTALMRDQAVFYCISYAVVLPCCLLLFALDVLPWRVAVWFYVLLVLEHLSHEIGRALIAMSEQVMASVVLFLRAGVWVIVVIPLLAYAPSQRSLETVLAAWAAGAFLSCAIGLRKVLAAGSWDLRRSVDWRWLRRGVRVATPLLVATLALKGLGTFDRYWVEAIGGLDVVAAYVLFVGIANTVRTFLEAGVYVFTYPGLIRAATRGDKAEFAAQMRSLALQTLTVAIVMSAVILIAIRPLLEWVDRPIYETHLDLLYWAIAAVLLNAAGMVLHYGIYAYRQDAAITRSHLLALGVFALTATALHDLGVAAVPIAVCVAHTSILIWKALVYVRIQRNVSSVLALSHS